jgi:hypothetical protein
MVLLFLTFNAKQECTFKNHIKIILQIFNKNIYTCGRHVCYINQYLVIHATVQINYIIYEQENTIQNSTLLVTKNVFRSVRIYINRIHCGLILII